MNRRRESPESESQSWGSVGEWMRGGAGCLGLLLVVCGLFFAIAILSSVWSMVNDAEMLPRMADTWRGAVGGQEPVLRFSDVVEVQAASSVTEATSSAAALAPVPGRRLEANLSGPVGLLFMLIFLVFLAWFTLGLIASGGKLVALMFPDKGKNEKNENKPAEEETPPKRVSVQA